MRKFKRYDTVVCKNLHPAKECSQIHNGAEVQVVRYHPDFEDLVFVKKVRPQEWTYSEMCAKFIPEENLDLIKSIWKDEWGDCW